MTRHGEGAWRGAGVTMEIKREYPAGSVPQPAPESRPVPCGFAFDKVAPKAETISEGLGVPLAMMLAMRRGTTPDGKSLIQKPANGQDGWTWTFTPTPVK